MSSQEYEKDIKRLVEKVAAIWDSEWSPTPRKKELECIAKELRDVANTLDHLGAAQTDIESLHDKKGDPDPVPGLDGYPIRPPAPFGWTSYKGTYWAIRDLAESALEAADALPSPHTKRAAPYAALCLVHLRCKHGYPRPLISNVSEAVVALRSILDRSGVYFKPGTPYSDEHVRGLLSRALKEFDPNFLPPGYEWIWDQ